MYLHVSFLKSAVPLRYGAAPPLMTFSSGRVLAVSPLPFLLVFIKERQVLSISVQKKSSCNQMLFLNLGMVTFSFAVHPYKQHPQG